MRRMEDYGGLGRKKKLKRRRMVMKRRGGWRNRSMEKDWDDERGR